MNYSAVDEFKIIRSVIKLLIDSLYLFFVVVGYRSSCNTSTSWHSQEESVQKLSFPKFIIPTVKFILDIIHWMLF